MAATATSSKTEIRDYQTQLNEAGAEPPLVVDGIWGPKTESAHTQWGDDVSGDASGSPTMGTGPEGGDPRFGIAGGAELWHDKTSGETYIVYMVPGTEDDPAYMRWTVPSQEDVQSFFGPDQPIVYAQEIETDDEMWADTVDFGSSDDIRNTGKSPFDSWASTLEVEAASQPCLLEDDYQELLAMSIIEGRTLTEAEIQSTDWWRTNTTAEKSWMELYHGDPSEAARRKDDNRMKQIEYLRASGMADANPDLANWMADKVTMGAWSGTEMEKQVSIMVDSYFDGEVLNQDLQDYIDDNQLAWDQTQDKETEVGNLVKRWLGTNFGNWGEEQISYWAGRLRNEDDAQEALMTVLKDQKQALFADYDREADYETIASPWRTMMRNSWGEVPNDSDQSLQTIINMNDAAEAGKYLTTEGLKRGNEYVVNAVQSDLNNAFGGA